MAIGYLDVPFEALREAADVLSIKEREKVCRILPSARFYIGANGEVFFGSLTCDRIGGDSTGVSAIYCHNCALKGEK